MALKEVVVNKEKHSIPNKWLVHMKFMDKIRRKRLEKKFKKETFFNDGTLTMKDVEKLGKKCDIERRKPYRSRHRYMPSWAYDFPPVFYYVKINKDGDSYEFVRSDEIEPLSTDVKEPEKEDWLDRNKDKKPEELIGED